MDQRLFVSTTMTSLLASIFGDKAASPSKQANNDLFSQPSIVVAPSLSSSSQQQEQHDDDDDEMDTEEQDVDTLKDKQPKPDTTTTPEADASPTSKSNDYDDGQHQQPVVDDDARTIFVGNLPVGTTRKDLARLFRDCGSILR